MKYSKLQGFDAFTPDEALIEKTKQRIVGGDAHIVPQNTPDVPPKPRRFVTTHRRNFALVAACLVLLLVAAAVINPFGSDSQAVLTNEMLTGERYWYSSDDLLEEHDMDDEANLTIPGGMIPEPAPAPTSVPELEPATDSTQRLDRTGHSLNSAMIELDDLFYADERPAAFENVARYRICPTINRIVVYLYEYNKSEITRFRATVNDSRMIVFRQAS